MKNMIDQYILRKIWQRGKLDNRGMGTVEIILIIIVLVGLVLIFKNQITSVVQTLMTKISNQANKI